MQLTINCIFLTFVFRAAWAADCSCDDLKTQVSTLSQKVDRIFRVLTNGTCPNNGSSCYLLLPNLMTILEAELETTSLNVRLQRLEEQQALCMRKVTELQSLVLNNYSNVERRRANGAVAFSVLLQEDTTNIDIGQTIKFSQILLNDGRGYSVDTGVFSAPVSGIYLFAYFIGRGTDIGQVWLRLMHNGQKVNAGVADQLHQYQDVQGGNLAILRLNRWDTVWIEAYHVQSARLDGRHQFTSFSGTLLQ